MNVLYSGAGVALMAGLLMGAAMKPNLRGDERPEGPQMFAGWSGTRSTGPFDPAMSYASYPGQLPDYVIGTDATRTVYYTAPPIEEPRSRPVAREAPPPPDVEFTRATYEDPPVEVVYPSLSGGAAYEADLPPAPQPPEDDAFSG